MHPFIQYHVNALLMTGKERRRRQRSLEKYVKEEIKFAEKYLSNINSFEDFVMNWLSEDKLDIYWHLMPQYKFITSAKDRNKIMVDFLGRFENVQNDFGAVTLKLGFKNAKLENI